jgi:hypothetical protein
MVMELCEDFPSIIYDSSISRIIMARDKKTL